MKNDNHDKQIGEHASDDLLLKPEVAIKLRRSRRTVDLWMREKKIPYFKVGGSVLFRWSDVVEALAKYRVN